MLPGFATDVIGLFFLLPFTRPLARKLLGLVVARRLGPATTLINGAPGSTVDGTVVEGTSSMASPAIRTPISARSAAPSNAPH